MPTVSVLLPVYNAAATLEEAVGSILAQDFGDFELILIDDGSTDVSGEMMARMAQSDGRIRLFSQPHGGIARALNLGIEASRAPLIARMDADDYAYPGRLKKQVEWLERHPATGLVSCLVAYGGDPAQQGGYAAHVDWLNGVLSARQISLNRFIDAPFAHPSVMFRRSCVQRFGPYDPLAGPEDYELWLRWMDAGVAMEKVPEVLLRWQDLPGRLSRQHPDYAPEAFDRVRARYLYRWLSRHNPYHPEVIIWGAGRKTRRRAEPLLREGCVIRSYLDFFSREAEIPIIDYREVERYPDAFILSFVNNRGAREEIRKYLQSLKKVEGSDFLIC